LALLKVMNNLRHELSFVADCCCDLLSTFYFFIFFATTIYRRAYIYQLKSRLTYYCDLQSTEERIIVYLYLLCNVILLIYIYIFVFSAVRIYIIYISICIFQTQIAIKLSHFPPPSRWSIIRIYKLYYAHVVRP